MLDQQPGAGQSGGSGQEESRGRQQVAARQSPACGFPGVPPPAQGDVTSSALLRPVGHEGQERGERGPAACTAHQQVWGRFLPAGTRRPWGPGWS